MVDGEVVDVFAVEGRDERVVEALDDVVDDLVADVLVLEDLAGLASWPREVGHELDEQLARPSSRLAAISEKRRKYSVLLGDEAELHGGPLLILWTGGGQPGAGARSPRMTPRPS